MTVLLAKPLTATAFAPFGDVLEATGQPDVSINAGWAGRWNDRAKLDFAEDGHGGVSMIRAAARALPYTFQLVEHHPLGSQAFVPMTQNSFLVIVAPDLGGQPGTPLAFITSPGQGINFHRGTWHGVLTPLDEPGLFVAFDWIGKRRNLVEYHYPQPYIVQEIHG
jgi:ureidoglycolate lyase